MSSDFYRSVGGKPIQMGSEEAWDFGWKPYASRTWEEFAFDAEARRAMVPFRVDGALMDDKRKVILTDLWNHPKVVEMVGFQYPGIRQVTGSCVGAGGGNVLFTLAAVEVVRLGDPEQVLVPFWLIPYCRSRYYAGMRGRGDGSLASAWAEAVRRDGVVPATTQGLPKWTDTDALCWGSSTEMEWSAGERIATSWLEQGRKHLVKTTSQIRNADELRDAIRAGYPCMFAGDWGGRMECPVVGDPPVLLNERRGTWMHNQMCAAWYDHPELGELFGVVNQWGLRAHGSDPAGLPGSGYWIKKRDADYQCRNGEVIAISQFNGFPALTLDWYI